MPGKNEASLKLSFDYDPEKLNNFLGDMQKMKDSLGGAEEELQAMGDTLSKFSKGFSTLSKGIGAALTGLAGKWVSDNAINLEKIDRQFKHFFAGVEKAAFKMSRELSKALSFDEAEIKNHMIEVQKNLLKKGIPPSVALQMTKDILTGTRDVATATGQDFEQLLSDAVGFISGGGALGNIPETFKKNERILESVLKMRRETILAGKTEGERAQAFFRQYRRLTQPFSGAHEADTGVFKTNEELTRELVILKNAIVSDLVPAIISLTKGLTEIAKAVGERRKELTGLVEKGLHGVDEFLGKPGAAGAGIETGIEAAKKTGKFLLNPVGGAIDFYKKSTGGGEINNNQKVDIKIDVNTSGLKDEEAALKTSKVFKQEFMGMFKQHQFQLTRDS